MTETMNRFNDICPIPDSNVRETIERLIANSYFRRATEAFVKPLSWEQFTAVMSQCRTKDDFQRYIIYPAMKQLIAKTTADMSGAGWENIPEGIGTLFISNHRDIVLDAAFLNMLMIDKEKPTTEIAIGDNLLIYPWIEELVRLNKSFIVKRGVSVRQMLEVSKHLSEYIYDTVNRRAQPAWIAQREGRAKDSNDKTQVSLLKMLTLHNSSDPAKALQDLHIVPLSISYELDPCDYLKAKEFQLKRDNPGHKKTEADDIENMHTGIMGFKGRVTFRFGTCIDQAIREIPAATGRNELLEQVASIIDREIYRNYTFFPFNYVAYDLMTDTGRFSSQYTDEDVSKFNAYLQKQIEKINIANRDDDFLRVKMTEMYGNTVKNHLEA
ncbi:Acyltransferase [Proteiniphilum saccharofermentans]|uniref:Acyltransferase n=1 Tax=Proteiniphilum saccharofermentans TaxID=1642647 RepID=A0A1R3T7D8_9BACT|nr:1-acyl-sn-glycerol-3-phosphate acyltransferase [Proteiniphilum saccharofermentans]SCD21198.1 Acyltransferase [Proteiniphilum saccharofermentans]SFT04190.1 Acyltransferase [Porphyromonadaceae bacterium NLAE-zl-C104]